MQLTLTDRPTPTDERIPAMPRTNRRIRIAAIALCALIVVTSGSRASATDFTVTNDASREVHGLYLSLTAQSGWGPDQLNGSALLPGGSFMLRGVTCPSQNIVLIAEDEGGCFLYQSVSCASDVLWAITSGTPRDCGR
jgi:hypothetical protein